jgi:hypothetical protein
MQPIYALAVLLAAAIAYPAIAQTSSFISGTFSSGIARTENNAAYARIARSVRRTIASKKPSTRDVAACERSGQNLALCYQDRYWIAERGCICKINSSTVDYGHFVIKTAGRRGT